jgi:ubiquinone/menaquinone biosynthesis C-methylase UbiE
MVKVDSRPETFKTRDAGSYDAVTQEFDRFTERLSRPLAEHLVTLARLRPVDRVLDIGTGTGVVAFTAAKQLTAEGRLLGVDLSEGMLAAARAKAADGHWPCPIEFRKMDAEALDLPDKSVDVVLSLFALLHFPDALKALREMRRVLRPGGRLALAVGSGPRLFSGAGLVEAVKHLRDRVAVSQGKLLKAPQFLDALAEKYLPAPAEPEISHVAESHQNRSRVVPELVCRAGFCRMATDWKGHLAEFTDPEEYWELQATFSSIARKRLAGAPPEKLAALREEFLRRTREVRACGGRLVYPFAAFFVAAERPEDTA